MFAGQEFFGEEIYVLYGDNASSWYEWEDS